MRRDDWAAIWQKPIYEWSRTYRWIRKVGPITPFSLIPRGAILLLALNANLPDGWEWATDIESKEVQHADRIR